jgi:hypothetical protein
MIKGTFWKLFLKKYPHILRKKSYEIVQDFGGFWVNFEFFFFSNHYILANGF